MMTQHPTLTSSASTQARIPAHQIFGMVGMVGSPFLFLSFAATGFQQEATSRIGSLLGLLFVIGWFSCILGLWGLHATGRRFGRIPLAVALVTVPLAGVFQVYECIAPHSQSPLFAITDTSWPLSMVLMLVIGIVAPFASGLRGWTRFVPLFCGLWLPVGIVISSSVDTTIGQIISGVYVTVGWFLLSYVICNGGNTHTR